MCTNLEVSKNLNSILHPMKAQKTLDHTVKYTEQERKAAREVLDTILSTSVSPPVCSIKIKRIFINE